MAIPSPKQVLAIVVYSLAVAVPLSEAQLSSIGRLKRSDDDATLGSLPALLQQQAAVIQSLQSDVIALETRLAASEARLTAQEQEMTSLKTRVAATSTAVAFSVRFTTGDNNDGLALGPGSTLKFDDVITNIGGAYDPATGMFTAPLPGTYAFFVSTMAANGHDYLHLAIDLHDRVLALIFAESGGDSYDQGSSLVTTHLDKGQQLWVRESHGDAVRGGFWTVFTGYLLQAD